MTDDNLWFTDIQSTISKNVPYRFYRFTMTDDIYDSMIYFWASWGLLYACWNTINMSGTTEFYVNLGTWYHLNPTETYWNHQPRNDGVNMCELPLRIKHWIFSWTTLIEISKIWLVKIGVAAKPLTSGSFLVLNHQRLGEQKKHQNLRFIFLHIILAEHCMVSNGIKCNIATTSGWFTWRVLDTLQRSR